MPAEALVPATADPEDVERKAWAIDFFEGAYKGDGHKNGAAHVRLVRTASGQAPAVAGRGNAP